MPEIVTRFAPSPTGHLHLGGARTAIFNWLLARHFKGKFYLRVEDTDLLRSRKEYSDSILASLRWLGLDWDGDILWQTKRADLYNAYVDKLLETGHAYWCDCSPEKVEAMREEARAKGLKPKYNGHCRDRGLGPGPGRCVRLKAPLSGPISFNDMIKGPITVDAAELDDMVLRRADGQPTYNMAVVVDDHETGVTHVIRGDDHVSNTPRQILIYDALGIKPPVFGHVPMILGPDRQKLSKRRGARAVIDYEREGLLPEALVNYLARLGWSRGDQEIFTRDELVEYFDGTHLNPASAAFDPAKLEWCDGQFLRMLPPEELAARVAPYVKSEGLWDALGENPETRLVPLCVMFRERATNLLALARAFKPLLVPADELEYVEKDAKKHFTPKGAVFLRAFGDILKHLPDFNAAGIETALNEYAAKNELKFKELAPPIRVALMGFMGGSHLNEIMAFLGREEILKRFARAAALCEKANSN